MSETEIVPLLQSRAPADDEGTPSLPPKPARLVSLDVFRGLCVFLMMVVDYAGSIFPIISHVPWNGLHLADLVMPLFLLVAGISVAVAYKKAPRRLEATWKALLRALKLFVLGILFQGGYFHGVNSFTYGVDIENIRWLGILQPQVKCSVRGDLGPACNSAGMIDRYLLGLTHLYAKPVYRNLKVCQGQVPQTSPAPAPAWCHAPFDPEGILSSIPVAVTCIIGLQYGHILIELQHHKERLLNWSISSFSFMGLALLLDFLGMPFNKSLYTISYMMFTSACAGITFCALYILVDVYGWRSVMYPLEWMGKHSLGIFVLVTSNIVVITVQGFYLGTPKKNIVHWIINRFVHK